MTDIDLNALSKAMAFLCPPEAYAKDTQLGRILSAQRFGESFDPNDIYQQLKGRAVELITVGNGTQFRPSSVNDLIGPLMSRGVYSHLC